MRVLHLVRQYSPSVGGLESHVKSLVRRQIEMGYDSRVVTLDRLFTDRRTELPHQEIIDDVPVRRVKFVGGRRFFLPGLSLAHMEKADIVHVHGIDGIFELCALSRPGHRKPMICTTHGGFFHTDFLKPLKHAYFHSLTRAAARSYASFIACSEADGELFRKITNRVRVLPNAVEPLSSAKGTGNDLVYIGRLSANKRLDRALKVHAHLTMAGYEGDFHIIGPEFDVSQAELVKIAEDLGTRDRVRFHGYLTKNGLEDVIKSCGYFFSASAYEGFGMTMIEGMAAGLLPVVHSNASFQRLQSEAGVGIATDFGRPEIAAGEIGSWMRAVDESQLGRSRAHAQEFAKRFSWPAYAEQVDAIYRSTLQGPQKGAALAA